MHIACDKKKLIENINIVQKCVSARTTSPILECILLIADRAGFRMLANDMELSIETTDIENTDVFKLGEVALNAKMLFDIIRTMPDGMIDIECDENFITTIKNGRSNFRISGLDGSEFPRPKEIEGAGVSAVKGDILKSMVKQTIFSIAAVDYSLHIAYAAHAEAVVNAGLYFGCGNSCCHQGRCHGRSNNKP